MNQEAQEKFDKILSKELYELKAKDIEFIISRRSYLNKEQREKYADYIEKDSKKYYKQRLKELEAKETAKKLEEGKKLKYRDLQILAGKHNIKAVGVTYDVLEKILRDQSII